MTNGLLVERDDGTFERVSRPLLQPTDRLVFDGPGQFLRAAVKSYSLRIGHGFYQG